MDNLFTFHFLQKMTKMYISICLATCGDPTLLNGSVNATKSPIITGYYSVGTNLTFSCHSGFTLDGNISNTCDTNGSWTPSPPTCRLGNCTKLIVQY